MWSALRSRPCIAARSPRITVAARFQSVAPRGSLGCGSVKREDFCVPDHVGDAPIEESWLTSVPQPLVVGDGALQHQVTEQLRVLVVNTVAADRPLIGEDLAGRFIDTEKSKSHQLPQNRCLATPRRPR
jgi:hypothetical protein